MHVTSDFRDMLSLLETHQVRYLVIGGYAFAFHAVPRYTKDLDIWVEDTPDNVTKTNRALEEFGSPFLLAPAEHDVILQLGVEPNRIDILRSVSNVAFEEAWNERVRAPYGDVVTNWIGLEALVKSKTGTSTARHDEDVRVLQEANRLGKGPERP